MIKELAHNLGSEMGVKLSRVSIVDGTRLGCLDVHLLHLSIGEHLTSALVHQSELDNLLSGNPGHRLETKIRDALLRLKAMLER
jgi:hypothetical protein